MKPEMCDVVVTMLFCFVLFEKTFSGRISDGET
jgi:hypothetical protein